MLHSGAETSGLVNTPHAVITTQSLFSGHKQTNKPNNTQGFGSVANISGTDDGPVWD